MERVHVVDVSKRKLEKKDAPAISNKPLDTDPCCQVSRVAKTFWREERVMLSHKFQFNCTHSLLIS